MPISEPEKVSTSSKATRTEECISPAGGRAIPATNNAHPKVHIAVARISCRCFIAYADSFAIS